MDVPRHGTTPVTLPSTERPGRTPYPAVIEVLLNAGADIEARNERQQDPPARVYSQLNENPAVDRILACDPNKPFWTIPVLPEASQGFGR